jgi:protein-disulfide isomerase
MVGDIMAKKKQNDTKTLVMATIIILILGLGIFSIFYNLSKPEEKTKVHHFSYENQPYLGKEDAPVQIVEFGDFKCPACAKWEEVYFPLLKKEFIDTGKVKFVFMNFPILGTDSYTAAAAGEAIYHQNEQAFWAFYSAIYKKQGDEREEWATPEFLVELAKRNVPGVDYEKLKNDLEQKTYLSEIEQDAKQGEAASVPGTPAFFINGKKIDSIHYEDMKAAIEQELKAGNHGK